jgi:hypothetical protein
MLPAMLQARAPPPCRGALRHAVHTRARAARAEAAPGGASAAPAAKPSRGGAPAQHAPPPRAQRRAFRFVNYGERADGPGFDATSTICCDGLVQARPARGRAPRTFLRQPRDIRPRVLTAISGWAPLPRTRNHRRAAHALTRARSLPALPPHRNAGRGSAPDALERQRDAEPFLR